MQSYCFSRFFLRTAQRWPSSFGSRYSTTSTGNPKIVIVGGVAGGATAAARLRRLSESAEIIVLEKGADVSFANCGLPYHIGGEIKQRSALSLHTPGSLGASLNIDVKTRHEVLKIDRGSKQLHVQKTVPDGGKETFQLSYDKLLISTGASPIRPKIPGIEGLCNVYTLRTLSDMDKIISQVDAMKQNKTGMRATVIGAGFIGLEMVEALMHQRIAVTLVEARNQVLPQLDYDMTQSLYQACLSSGVDVVLSDKVVGFERESSNLSDPEKVTISLDSGRKLAGNQLVILSIGVRPDSQLAGQAGLKLHPQTSAIMVNDHLQTDDHDIYAVGDAVQTRSRWSQNAEDPTNWVPLAGPANRQARIAAENMLSSITEPTQPLRSYHGTLGTSIVRFGDVVAAVTGYTEAALAKIKKTDYASVLVSGYSHASYYPGALPLYLKVTYDTKTQKILGAQACGGDGVDKRIDILATAISGGFTIDKLEHLELCYAPCFGTARDIVNTAGFFAYNVNKGLVKVTDSLPVDASQQVVDVRPAITSILHPIPGAKNIPLDELRQRSKELNHDQPLVTACAYGKTSYFAARTLMQSGFSRVSSLMGGWNLRMPPQLQQTQDAAPPPAITAAPQGSGTEVELDCCGLACPGPVMKIRQELSSLQKGQVVKVTASDSGFGNDFEPFCKTVGVEFLGIMKEKGIFTGKFRVPDNQQGPTPVSAACSTQTQPSPANKDVAIVLFSGDLDKALAALVIANGAIALGGKVTIFCTFWGLNALRQDTAIPTKKSFLDRMFGMMMPRGINKLTLSRMNFAGAGTAMMKHTMSQKGLPNLPGLLKDGMASGQLNLVACGMSMDALGIQKEELIPCEVGGVAQFLSIAQNSQNTIFI